MEPHIIKAKCDGAVSTQSQEECSKDEGGGRGGTGCTTTITTAVGTSANILPPISASGEVDPNAIVIGDVTGCMVMELQDGVVRVQDHSHLCPRDNQAPSDPYLVDVVHVDQGHRHQLPGQVSPPTRHQQLHQLEESTVQGGRNDLVPDAARSKDEKVGKCAGKANSGVTRKSLRGKKSPAEFVSRWNFKEVLPKSEPAAILDAWLKEENIIEADTGTEGDDDTARPRRKSAKKARLRWKSIHDVDCLTKSNSRKGRRVSLVPSKHLVDISKDTKACVVMKEELPMWARQLTSVQVLDNKWVVGVAASNAVLNQTLEGHSRSVLCDYVKSHPSQLQSRHQLRAQESRLVWQHKHIRFDGVPFSIFSSDELKCAFAMNYKLKRKDSAGGNSKSAEGNNKDTAEESNEADSPSGKTPGTTQQAALAQAEGQKTKKPYRNVFYTKCPAKIRVKVIIKYPAYAISVRATSNSRREMLKSLRQDLQQGRKVAKEQLYHISLPLSCVHNHPLCGQSRSVHPSILCKIRELVGEGVTAPKTIKATLEQHVECCHRGDTIVPHPEDRAYYPRLKDIGNFVYTYCKRMGISAKRKTSGDTTFEISGHKRKRKNTNRKGERSDEENDGGCSDSVAGAGRDMLPLQASTLQEAVQTFCTDESDKPTGEGLEESASRECVGGGVAPLAASRIGGAPEAISMPEMVRNQLDVLRSLTYTLQDENSLQDIHQTLQTILSSFVGLQSQQTVQEGTVPEGAATFIIQDPLTESLPSSASAAPCLTETPQAEQTDISGREGQASAGTSETSKPRSAAAGVAGQQVCQGIAGQQVCQLRPPVAVHCLTVPTLAVSQLPTRPPVTQNLVASLPALPHSYTPATPAQPTYQTLGPVSQEGPAAPQATPVHLSIPPYFYYLQEVSAVTEPSQPTWTYTSSS